MLFWINVLIKGVQKSLSRSIEREPLRKATVWKCVLNTYEFDIEDG